VQLEHHVHEAFVELRLCEHGARARIDRDRLEVVRGRRRGREGDEPQAVVVLGLRGELHHAVGVPGLRDFEHAVEADVRRARGHLRRLDLGAQQVADLVMEDQRQAGEAQQQHEHRAHEAAPLVHPGPGLDLSAVHVVAALSREGF